MRSFRSTCSAGGVARSKPPCHVARVLLTCFGLHLATFCVFRTCSDIRAASTQQAHTAATPIAPDLTCTMATTSTLTTFDTGHMDMVHDIQFDYYGRRVASCSSDRTIKIFDVAGGQPRQLADLIGHEGPVWAVSWGHPKFGTLLASCSYDHRVIVWKETQEAVWTQVDAYTSHPMCRCTHIHHHRRFTGARCTLPASTAWHGRRTNSALSSPAPRQMAQSPSSHTFLMAAGIPTRYCNMS